MSINGCFRSRHALSHYVGLLQAWDYSKFSVRLESSWNFAFEHVCQARWRLSSGVEGSLLERTLSCAPSSDECMSVRVNRWRALSSADVLYVLSTLGAHKSHEYVEKMSTNVELCRCVELSSALQPEIRLESRA
ncbi:hypothetical protein HELRODRAFT_178162 [Helobdella robusta]|uniref:Uncharacterized protein n=1 Tax=Helobdella robusta TaxID=6412 RepID=T1FCV1_HELRO|nr:hypothetical protein HELRODRAFT_178162 [Helobdella robusta]ESN97372.1 hypothetical protein HELRODRAFT_178162 [Helobdella robusta]